MIQLIYTSVATDPITPGLIDNICRKSRLNNHRDEITGIIIANRDHFLQTLEGPRSTVEDTFLRMMLDPRHHSLTLLSRRLLTRREFGEWEIMPCAGIACIEACAQIGGILDNAANRSRRAFDEFFALLL